MKIPARGKLLLLAGSSMLLLADASAADWHFDPRLTLTGVYDDNRFMDTDPALKDSVNGVQLDAAANIAANWQRSSLRLAPHIWTYNYPSDSEYDETSGEVGLFFDHAGETSKSGLRANYSRRSLLKTVLLSPDADAELGESTKDSGARRLSLDNKQDYLYVDPSFEWTLNPRNRLLARGEYATISYDQQASDEYIDNQSLSGSLGWSYDFSRRTTLSFSGSVAHYTPDVGADTNVFGLRAEWSRRVTEISRYYFRVGMSRAETGTGAASLADNAVSAGAGINWAFRVTGIFLDATRNVLPNPSGVAITQDELRLRIERQFKPRLSGFFNFVGLKDNNIADSTVSVPRKYAAAQTGFEWRLRKTFTLVGAYSHVWQKYDDDPRGARSNSANLSLVYEPHRPEWITGVFR